MSLVGTRPPTVDEWEQYELHHRSRMSIKPGMDYDAVRKKNDDISKQLKLALSEVKYELLTPSKYEI